jgi:hypothetical protein
MFDTEHAADVVTNVAANDNNIDIAAVITMMRVI